MQDKIITLRCDDGVEACVFRKYNRITYEIVIEDSYAGGDYRGFFGRIKRAWKAFWAKPLCYTGVYCEDGNRMREFLEDCLRLTNEAGGCQSTKEETLNLGYGEDDADCWCE
jgi:hypothetical protein